MRLLVLGPRVGWSGGVEGRFPVMGGIGRGHSISIRLLVLINGALPADEVEIGHGGRWPMMGSMGRG